MGDNAATILAGIIYMAILLLLVRPSSKAPTVINNIFGALTDLVKGTTGYQP